jgi:Glycosyltransferase
MTTALFAHPGAELFGSDRMVIESVAGSVAAGLRTVVALPSTGPLVDDLRRAGAEVVIVPMLVLRKALLKPRGWGTLIRDTLRGWGSARRLLRKVRPDVVYVNTITIPQWTLAARLSGVPAVSHVHEAEASGNRLVNAVLYAPHTLAAAVLVNSEFSRGTITRSNRRLGERAQVVYNGVVAPASPRPPRPSIEGPLRVLYLGRLSPRKGPDLLIDVTARLAERGIRVDVDLVGSVFDGYEWYEQELRERIDAAGLHDRVRLHGFHTDIWPFLDDADVLVVPSRVDEPFGNTAVEGVLALRPVVASDTSGLREATAGHPTTFLVRPDDAGAIADALAEITVRWGELTAQVEESAARATARHAPEAYRRRIAEALTTQAAGEPAESAR